MKIIFISEYKIIQEGFFSMVRNKYSEIDGYLTLNDAWDNLINSKNCLIIYTMFSKNVDELTAVIELKDKYNDIKLLIIDFNYSNELFFKFSKIKIEGYILGTFAKEDIEYALHKIANGSRFYDRELLYKLVDEENESNRVNNKNIVQGVLTKRETEILCQLAKGLSNFQIACNLNISENTVKKHASNIFVKINVKDRTQATIYAYDMKLVSNNLKS